MGKEIIMGLDTAVFGGGCFWCLEAVFKMIKGVKKVESGYAGGSAEDPSYEKVCSGTTGHAEVVRIHYDPEKVSYRLLLEIFFASHDPTTLNRQGNDIGTQYRSIILYTTPEQKKAARDYIQKLKDNKTYPSMIVTEVEPLEKFYKGEDYHQDYFANNERAPYCRAVVSPKVNKAKQEFKAVLK
jgi:peptide-methionine (S)-S-oxide reductase